MAGRESLWDYRIARIRLHFFVLKLSLNVDVLQFHLFKDRTVALIRFFLLRIEIVISALTSDPWIGWQVALSGDNRAMVLPRRFVSLILCRDIFGASHAIDSCSLAEIWRLVLFYRCSLRNRRVSLVAPKACGRRLRHNWCLRDPLDRKGNKLGLV